MSFRISAVVPDGRRIATTRLQAGSVLVVCQRWTVEGYANIAIVDDAGQSFSVEDFRRRRESARTRFGTR